MTKAKLRPTKSVEIPQVNNLIMRSKAHWQYDPRYLAASREFLVITEEWLTQNFGYCITDETERIVGFIGIEPSEQQCYLEHLWIDPPFIGKGFGHQTMDWLLLFAKQKGFSEIRLLPDPPAEGFYQKMGARFSGKKVQSRVDAGPLFQEMIITLD